MYRVEKAFTGRKLSMKRLIMARNRRRMFSGCFLVLLLNATLSAGHEPAGPAVEAEPRKGPIETPTTEEPRAEAPKPLWHYGTFLDGTYALDFNFPGNHLFRNRSTAPRVNEGDLNMAAVYIKKDVSELSRWGTELLVQGGEDSKAFGFSAIVPNLPGSSWLRQLGRERFLPRPGRLWAHHPGLHL